MVSVVNRLMNVYQEVETEALIEQCRRGDSDALRVLYNCYYPKLLSTARHYVDEDTARDIVHDSLLMALSSLGSLRDARRIEPWLVRIVRNMALNHIKHEHVITKQSIETVQDIIPEPEAAEPLIPMDVLMSMVNRLPDGYEQVFRLRTMAGLSHDEISQRLGITSSTSRSQYTHARRMLKKMVQHWWMMLLILAIGSLLYVVLNHPSKHQSISDQPTTAKTPPAISIDSITKKTAIPVSPRVVLNEQMSSVVFTDDEVPSADTIKLCLPTDTTEESHEPPVQEDKYLVMPPLPSRPMQIQKMPIRHRQSNDANTSIMFAISGWPEPSDFSQQATIQATSSIAPAPIGSEAPSPIDFTDWTEYYHFIEMEADANPTEENISLRRIAGSNAAGNPQQNIEEHAHHDMPFTLGLSVNRNIAGRWSLGTGLNYSRLHSTFDLGYSQAYIHNEQTIHYLGVPVNASYSFLQGNRWNLYGTAGVTLDIPVAHSWKTRHLLNGQTIYSQSSNINVPVQWSFNAGLGVQYNFTPHFGVFMQPGATYYLNNGTKTIRTEHPWSITIPIGFRFTW